CQSMSRSLLPDLKSMKIIFVLCHASSALEGEVREAVLAKELRRLGHDARVFRLSRGEVIKLETFEGTVPVTYYPSDNPQDGIHQQISSLLADDLAAEPPHTIIFKGLGYAISDFVLPRLDLNCIRIGFIIGGQPFHPALRYADFVLAESEQQANGIRNFFERSVPVNVLSKYVNWPLAER